MEVEKIRAEIKGLLMLADSSIIKLVELMVSYAYYIKASDLHLEPGPLGLVARVRVDGLLADAFTIPNRYYQEIIARIKVLAGLRLDEHQAAQDGRFRQVLTCYEDDEIEINKDGEVVDIRVAIVPTYHGENAVLRLLTASFRAAVLTDLGFTAAQADQLAQSLLKAHGMILVTGPTGSGKTTTLYSLLGMLNTRDIAIATIEDPIEYELTGCRQLPVNLRTGLTFAHGLRALLRQDPNIIMVGEIRDRETAVVAVQAALTGHRLLSTLHTNDAATAVVRLLDMGIENYLAASTIQAIVGQRLVRKLCSHCRSPFRYGQTEWQAIGRLLPELVSVGLNHQSIFYRPAGCADCQSGYRGRLVISEVLLIDDAIRQAILAKASAGEITRLAISQGMKTLVTDGVEKIGAGLTTVEEIMQLIHD